MKKLSLLSLLVLLIGFSACKKKNKGESDFEINLKSTYGAESFHLNKTLKLADGSDVNITEIRFFVSDITLVSDDGEKIISDISEIDFDNNHSTAADAERGESILIENVKSGEYTGLKFGVGVSAVLNTTEPADYTDGEPLSQSGEHWLAWSSYIYAKVEGRIDTVGSGVFDQNFFYHTGTEVNYREKSFDEAFSLEPDETYTFQLNMDVERIFTDLDVVVHNMNHNPSDVVFLGKISDNIAASITK